MERLQFLKGVAGSGLLLSALPLKASAVNEGEQLDRALVKEFVGICHRDLDKAREMLEEHPTLLNAAHDWERGDFETGLGAASHVGHMELASYLLEKGAQTNIFTATLFGKTDIVMPMLTAFPYSLRAKGPHGYTLLHHAELGGDPALEIKNYLQANGVTEKLIPLF
jgi:hypothetical protein